MSGRPRLVVADPGLTGPDGHHLHYSEGVAEAAHACGMRALVLAGKEFAGVISGGRIDCISIFTARYQTSGGGGWPRQALFSAVSHLPAGLPGTVAPPMRRLRRLLRQSGAPHDPFGRELAAALEEHGPGRDDIVLLHSVSAANLASLLDALAPDQIRQLLIVLRRTPQDMDTDDPGPEPVAVLLRRLGERYEAKLSLYADTKSVTEILRTMTGGHL
jgi:hypothetical protein